MYRIIIIKYLCFINICIHLVMVFIHGGGWSGGSGTSENYGAERFLDYGVVSRRKMR
jgi:hypothetical protein